MEINKLTKRKLKLFMSLIGNLIIAVIISILIYFILELFFENSLSELVARLNYDLYSWIVYNRDIVVYLYIWIVLAVIIYRFISKYVDSINEVYKSLDSVSYTHLDVYKRQKLNIGKNPIIALEKYF